MDLKTWNPKQDAVMAKDWNPKRWLRILLPLLLIILWLGAAAVGGPTFGKLSSVSSNDQASFLPASAESTAARDWQQKFLDSNAIPAIVLLESDTPIPPAEFGREVSTPVRGMQRRLGPEWLLKLLERRFGQV